MKKKILVIFPVLIIIIIIKYLTGNYEITYKIDDYLIKETSSKNEMHFIITHDNVDYDFIYLESRKLSKKRVTKITLEEINDNICLTPKIKGYESYTLCNHNEEIITKELAEDTFSFEEFNEDFKYNKLTNNEYMLIWKYDGFYYLNGNEYKSINLFNTNRYSNDLMYQIDKYLIFPKYENNYEFNSIYILDITTGKYKEINTSYSINYDSYYAGSHKNNIYLFDNKNENLYEINYIKSRVTLIGSNIKGYIKFVESRKENASLTEYTKDKITYFEENEKIMTADNNYLIYNDYKVKYFNENVKVINTFNNNIYFIYRDNIYKYNDKIQLIAHYFELNFNNNNLIFVYDK